MYNIYFGILFVFIIYSNVFIVNGEIPICVAGWSCENCRHLQTCNKILENGGTALDAVQFGVQEAECLNGPAGCADVSVGWGGDPNQEGEPTLDALITDGRTMNSGAVADIRGIRNAVGVARLVLEHTTHSILAGQSATDFALKFGGFQFEETRSNVSDADYAKWKANNCQPNYWVNTIPSPEEWTCGEIKANTEAISPFFKQVNHNNNNAIRSGKLANRISDGAKTHDTLPMIAIDKYGNIAAATTTNGLAYRISGRVGDSPIVGSGNYAMNGVGGCGAFGNGDVMQRFAPCVSVIEQMRLGLTPEDAVADVVARMVEWYPGYQGTVFAVNATGSHSSMSHTATNEEIFEEKFQHYNTMTAGMETPSNHEVKYWKSKEMKRKEYKLVEI